MKTNQHAPRIAGLSTLIMAVVIVLLGSQPVLAQWTTPNASQNINNTNTGNVGIGTSSPDAKLQIHHSSANNNTANIQLPDLSLAFRNTSNTNGNMSLISFQDAAGFGNAQFGAIQTNQANHNADLVFFTRGSTFAERMRIRSDGNVGIGTTTPGYKLDVNGNLNVQGGTTFFRQSSGLAGNEGAYISIGATVNNEAAFALGVYRAGLYTNRFLVNSFGNVILQPNADMNVGIATNTPNFRLDVGGHVNASGGLCIAGDCKTAWSQVGGGGGTSQWTTASSNIYYNSGNVGIGTTAPNYRLEVQSPSRYSMAVLGDGDTVGYSGITIGARTFANIASNRTTHFNLAMRKDSWFGGDGSGPSFIIEAVNNNIGGYVAPFMITPNNNVILNGGQGANALSYGNVGIGTTAPTAKLHLNGGSFRLAQTAGETPFQLYSYLNSDSLWLTSGNSTKSEIHLSPNYAVDYDRSAALQYVPGPTGTLSGALNIGQLVKNNASWTHGTTSIFTAGVERLRINSVGNVGIGTSSPGSGFRLDVQGGKINASDGLCIAGDCKTAWSQVGGTGGSSQWTNSTSGSNIFYNSGSVGIGIAAPIYSLDVNGGVNAFRAKAASALGGDTIASFESASGIQAIVRANGNVGIGTANPGSKLFVGSGSPAVSTLPGLNVALGSASYISASNGTENVFVGADGSGYGIFGTLSNHALGFRTSNQERVRIDTSGNVGIGTNSPLSKLHVVGDGKVTGNLTVDGIIHAKYQDVAEWVPAAHAMSPGTVAVLNPNQSNQVMASGKAYDTRVAGVISEVPGLMLGESGPDKVLVATTGRVRVKVDATRAPIAIGDLLVTSDIEGVAMKSQPIEIGGVAIHRPGTLIGKALEPLAKGKGEILVLLSLQ